MEAQINVGNRNNQVLGDPISHEGTSLSWFNGLYPRSTIELTLLEIRGFPRFPAFMNKKTLVVTFGGMCHKAPMALVNLI
jgi:hypothetical protein